MGEHAVIGLASSRLQEPSASSTVRAHIHDVDLTKLRRVDVLSGLIRVHDGGLSRADGISAPTGRREQHAQEPTLWPTSVAITSRSQRQLAPVAAGVAVAVIARRPECGKRRISRYQ